MTIHETCVATSHVPCVCGARPDKPCACRPGRFHLARFARARADDVIDGPGLAEVITDGHVDGTTTLVIDPGEAA
jgi:hypothetical protein